MSHADRTHLVGWVERFRIYFLGVGIGLVIVALIVSVRSQFLRGNQAETSPQTSQGQQPPAAVPSGTPSPSTGR